jgi:hypothetical protein
LDVGLKVSADQDGAQLAGFGVAQLDDGLWGLLSREKAIDLAAPGLVNDDADRFALFGLERELLPMPGSSTSRTSIEFLSGLCVFH